MRIQLFAIAATMVTVAPAAGASGSRRPVPLSAIAATSWWPPQRDLPAAVWASDLQRDRKDETEIHRRQSAVTRQLAAMARAGLLAHGGHYPVYGPWRPPIGVNLRPNCNARRGPIVSSQSEAMMIYGARLRQSAGVLQARLFGDADGFDAAQREAKKIGREIQRQGRKRRRRR